MSIAEMRQLLAVVVSELKVQETSIIPAFALNPDISEKAGKSSMAFLIPKGESFSIGQIDVSVDTHIHETDTAIKNEILRQLIDGCKQ